MPNDDHVHDLIPAYALGSLDEAEMQAVKSHQERCEFCRAELRAYEEVSGQIALSVAQVDPPAKVKSVLMANVRASLPYRKDFENRKSIWERLGGALLRFSPVLLVASLLVVSLLGASNLLLWQQVRELRQNQAEFVVIPLSGTEAAPGATGMIVISTDGTHGTLIVDRLADLGETEQYQLWLIQNGERTSGGVFSVGQDGYGSLWVSSPQPLAGYSAFGITVEPAGGSPGPTGARVLGSDL
jgi:anti-sigma-K factor RskA